MSNEEIVKEIQSGYNKKENMEKLWNNMEKLIQLIAKEFYGYEEVEDLTQEGYIALYDAIKNYDESKGVKFSNYAAYWIKTRMTRYICECSKLIRIPEHAENTRRKYEKFISEHEKEYGKKPTRGQICHFLDIDIETLNKIEKNQNIAKIASTDKQIETDDGNSATIIDTIPGIQDENSIIEQIENNMLIESICKIIEELPELEQKIIIYRYIQELKNIEISQKLNISQSKISKIHSKAMRHLRKLTCKDNICSESRIARCYAHVGLNAYNTTWNSVTERVALRL